MSDKLCIEVAYALPEKQYVIPLTLPPGSTVEQAILASGLLQLHGEIDLRVNKVGIFSRAAKLTDTVQNGDRVEIYRPLIADPKALRRQRVEHNSHPPATKQP